MVDVLGSRWGVQLEGDAHDLDNLITKINGSILSKDSPFVAFFNQVPVLRWIRWDTAPDFDTLKSVAAQDLALMVACMSTLDASLDITIGTLFEFDAEDNFLNRMRETPISIIARKPVEEHATPADFRALLAAATHADAVALALRELTPLPQWFEIYKAMEALIRHYGSESAFFQRFVHFRGQVEIMKRTANSFRHVEGKFAPIGNPMPIHEAQELIRTLIISAASDVPVPPCNGAMPLGIRNHVFEPDALIALEALTLDMIGQEDGA